MTAAPILAALLALAPHGRVLAPPGWTETRDAYHARLASIAEDIAHTAGSISDAAALVGIAWHESGFAPDVDAGRCYAGWIGRCDAGRAASLWQLQAIDGERLSLYQTSRREAAKEALRRVRRSVNACKGPPETRLAAYASGTCERGHAGARRLHGAAKKARALIDAARAKP